MKRFMLLLLVCANLMAQSSPVRIELEELTNPNYPGIIVPRVKVTSLVDSIVIKDIVVNKGHCPMNFNRKPLFPWSLRYGEQAIGAYSSACHVLKINVKTNQGDWVVEY
jgi:hypothetical protein